MSDTPDLFSPEPPKPESSSAGSSNADSAKADAPKKPRRKLTGDGGPSTPRKKRSVKPPPPPPPPKQWWAVAITVLILLIDQLSKWIVVQVMNLKEVQAIDVIDPYLNLRMAWNQGVNFGLFSSDVEVMRWVLIAVAAVIVTWVTVWLWRTRPGALVQVAAGLLIGGALGNVIDRFIYGAVADFLNMSLPGWRNPYSFNVADIAIFAGALGLVFQPAPKKAAAQDKTRDAPKKTR